MLNKKNVSHESGLTLIEILASLVILGIVIVSFLSIFSQSALYNKKTDDLNDNTNYAEDLMELFVAYSQKGSSLESVDSILLNGQGFKKVTNLKYNKSTSKGFIEVIFEEQDKIDGYRVTRVIINNYSSGTDKPNSIIESLLYWRTSHE
ncbi:type II secretion system protein [Sporosarcina jeotgali]|uniref:Type II secretion system protein n=1 Tax=Sporosarcina jeotgali TaxID=3020056 RepID=A0ABZ0KU12_9BACL|nr:type II secretion system protein [Sporosarcina sp. B2O-1]WOV82948.1 type II secretion system protein [Sporosarcina sp. B2O-1]